jgi:hypothetical protein
MARVTQAPRPFQSRRVALVASVAALAGWVTLAFGFAGHRRVIAYAYLTAFAAVASLALGALFFLMIHYAAGARWHTVVRRLGEGIVGALPLLALLFVPVVLSLRELYAWTDLAAFHERAHAVVLHKRGYLNGPAFAWRAAGYFVVWLLAAELLRRWSFARDPGSKRARAAPSPAPRDPDVELHPRERAFSSALLPLVSLALTFAAFDWVMSLEPLWYSTMFGVYVFAGAMSGSIALITLLAFATARSDYAPGAIGPAHFHALGRLMLTFAIFWAYCAFFQALLIQIADKPVEVAYYLRRIQGGWAPVTLLLVLVRFALPFAVLLPRAPKFDGRLMALVGGLGLFAHYVDVYWLVAPVDRAHHPLPGLFDLAALLAVAGTAVAGAALRLHGRLLVPLGDPAFSRSIEYRSPL